MGSAGIGARIYFIFFSLSPSAPPLHSPPLPPPSSVDSFPPLEDREEARKPPRYSFDVNLKSGVTKTLYTHMRARAHTHTQARTKAHTSDNFLSSC